MKIKKLTFIQLVPAYFFVLFLVSQMVYSSLVKPRISRDALYSWLNKTRETKKESPPEKPGIISGKPVSVAVPKLGIKIAIIEGNYENDAQKWNVSSSQAHFATVTSLPNNQANNTLIYGHNSPSLFGKTDQLVEGDKLYLWTDNDLLFEYDFVTSEEVLPENTQVFDYEGEPRVTLITCAGLLNEKRKVITFNFYSVYK